MAKHRRRHQLTLPGFTIESDRAEYRDKFGNALRKGSPVYITRTRQTGTVIGFSETKLSPTLLIVVVYVQHKMTVASYDLRYVHHATKPGSEH